MSFPYKKVLVIGATSGIGLALAERMIANGSHVIAVGRRQKKLDFLVQKYSGDKISTINFDITSLSSIPSFVESVFNSHSDLDCVFLNSGIQSYIDFAAPSSINLDTISTELTTNYLAYIHILKFVLPHLLPHTSVNSLIFTTSGLGLIPIPYCSTYAASKAALRHLVLAMREQLKATNTRVIEILPPAVRTEFHDDDHLLTINGRNIAMPLEEFVEEAWGGLCKGKTQIPIGRIEKCYETFEGKRQDMFQEMMRIIGEKS